ncbi:MAG: cell envelope integrity EipB family protein [Bradyrhizobiaceae bacterium]|nr:cell envelope integrity EipB family protein [Hyphomicrobiales bacterium]MBV9427568.1 cell envelope integrity EipB family protein [Bradyrhizobiaceae bacterium]
MAIACSRVAFSLAMVVAVGAALLGTASAAGPAKVDDPSAAIALAPHRAIYDLKLGQLRGKRSLEAVRGRIVYDFNGNMCDGYDLRFRQVTELDSGEGKYALSDLRSTSWEEGAAHSLRFDSQNYLDQKLVDSVDGHADKGPDGVTVKLAKPKPSTMDIGTAVFPSEHMRRIIAAAREGKTLLEVTVYDGSETGDKVYQSLTVIGKKIAPNEQTPTDAAANQTAVAGLDRWPVTISYFDRAQQGQGEQTPVYAISFEAYENGIARALVLDYGDFTVSGDLTSLEMKDAKPCGK